MFNKIIGAISNKRRNAPTIPERRDYLTKRALYLYESYTERVDKVNYAGELVESWDEWNNDQAKNEFDEIQQLLKILNTQEVESQGKQERRINPCGSLAD